MNVTNFFEALEAGKQLQNATTWKNAQLVASKLMVIASVVIPILSAFGYSIPLTETQLGTIFSAIGIIAGLFFATSTVVSTTKIGLRRSSGSAPTDGDNGGGDTGDTGSPPATGGSTSSDDSVSLLTWPSDGR